MTQKRQHESDISDDLKQPFIYQQRGQQQKLQNLHEQKDDSESEEEQRIRRELQQLKKQIKIKKKIRRANDKVFVGTGFGFDITEFFKFKKKKQLQSGGDSKSIFQQISGGRLSIIILIYSVINAAMIPPWIMNIGANKLLRISWRFLLQTFMIIPFLLYEKRTANPQTLQKYDINHIFKPLHLKKAYLSSFATSFWFTVILTAFEWTYISHAMFLGSMANVFLSLSRTTRGNGHDLQPGGQLLILVGIILIFIDTWTLRVEDVDQDAYNFINYFYLTRNQVQRLLGDLVALIVSYCMSTFSVHTSDLKNYYPPYLSMILVNSMISVNMAISAFFFNGATFDFDEKYGVFSIFSQKHFAGFLYMAIILCMGLMISFLLISKLFPNPIIPSLAMTFEPGISTMIIYLVGVQSLPGPFAFIGYIFIIPGKFLILIGQWIFQRQHKKQQIEEKKRLSQLIQLSEERQHTLRTKRSESKKRSIEIEMREISQSSHPLIRNSQSKSHVSRHIKIPKRLKFLGSQENKSERSPISLFVSSEQGMKKKQVSFKQIQISGKDHSEDCQEQIYKSLQIEMGNKLNSSQVSNKTDGAQNQKSINKKI